MTERPRKAARISDASQDEAEPSETPISPKQEARYFASIYPGQKKAIPEPLGIALTDLGKSLSLPIWCLIQDHDGPLGHLNARVFDAFHAAKSDLRPSEPIALVIHSPGGNAKSAYQIARMLKRRCGKFTAIVPKEAMSAATLLALGADTLIMGADANLGPLDAQLFDPDTETFQSALDEVQALERLHAYALESIDELMLMLLGRTGKKIESILPHTLRFTADVMRPMLEKIDVVHYNERARILKVAEEYAIRLLETKYPDSPIRPDGARRIAARLVQNYPEHPFPIDREEAGAIGLEVDQATDEQDSLLENLWDHVDDKTILGRVLVEEVAADDS